MKVIFWGKENSIPGLFRVISGVLRINSGILVRKYRPGFLQFKLFSAVDI